jgi:fructose-1,6-bisphosphatase/inositol monophosphatase family enzyme
VRSLGSTAYHVALVARGMAEAALVAHPRVWDLAAPGAVLEAVGGRYEYLGGGIVDLEELADGRRGRDYVLAGSPEAIAALRPLVGRRA